jgi:hypothetical protein
MVAQLSVDERPRRGGCKPNRVLVPRDRAARTSRRSPLNADSAPPGTQAESTILPAGFATRAISAAAAKGSDAKITPKTEITTSATPSGSGSASAAPSTNLSSNPRARASLVRCARDGRQGRPNEDKPFGAQTSSMHSELGVRARRRWELNPRPGFCRPLPEPLGYAAGDRCWCRWLRCRRAAAPANPTAAA